MRIIGIVVAATVGVQGLAGTQGYYRTPSVGKDVIVFCAEGDLWKVPLAGGIATRLTTHAGEESGPRLSPDGQTVAFAAQYEGPPEVYTMPLSGGLPTRRTFDGSRVTVAGWTPSGGLMYSTEVYSTLPNWQLCTMDLTSGARESVPLAQASAGCYDDSGKTLYFTRLQFQGSFTKRYKGGTAQNLWKFTAGDPEAVALTADYPGTSKNAMWWSGRVYFATDRDGTMNIWSMDQNGKDLRQHTRHEGFDVGVPALGSGRIAYQVGADLWLYDIAADKSAMVPIALESDFDQMRENWVPKPVDFMTRAHVSPDGDRAVITARGRVFVPPARQGRLVEAARKEGVRYRDARFMPDGKSLVAFSDESGEVELWKLPANGVGAAEQLTRDGEVLRWDMATSPDGKWIAHHDKNYRLWLLNVETKEQIKVDESTIDSFGQMEWSPDSAWLAYVGQAPNLINQIKLYKVGAGQAPVAVTSDRFDSFSPAFSPDGKWLYLISDRHLKSVVESPWGPLQPEPFFDKKSKVYMLALREGLRSPFAPKDELQPKDEKKGDAKDEKKDEKKEESAKDKPADGAAEKGKDEKAPEKKAAEVVIELAGIEKRLMETPIAPGNYGGLSVTEKALFWSSTDSGEKKTALQGATITNENFEVKTLVSDIKNQELSLDGKKLLVHKGDALYIIDATPADKVELDKKSVNLSNWTLSVVPREEWRQMFTEAWRLERDYFYDRKMHGVDWKAMLAKYLPLVDRVTTRAELSDVIAQMVAELSALHIFVRGGDLRQGEDNVAPSALGALLLRDEAGGGWRVERVYESDPDAPERASPLARPGVEVKAGDVIEMINGVPTLSVADCALLLRAKAGAQVLLRVKPKEGEARAVIVTPMTLEAASDLRYHEWEYTRRKAVEETSKGEIGYVHLRAMGGGDFADFARGFYPAFNRQGLIIDVRHNRGGNIDSWVLEKLMRKAWFYWNDRVGKPPAWNMQYAFRGHMVVLCNERTASDGEAFSEGFRRLGLGKVMGTRTWGGEIWLSSSNFLVDRGIATAAETGVYGPEGEWLIEGWGVEPDIVVDNLPHATFKGEDAQLAAAIEHLQKLIKEKPVPPVEHPPTPDKSFKGK